MENENAIQLRLRFYKDVPETVAEVRALFEDYKSKCPAEYTIKVNDTHIWFHIVGPQRAYYSPHLHLELESLPESGTHIRGLFGPDPTLWTLFMFLHFIVAGVFVIFGVMAYSNWTLKQPILWNIFIMGMMVGVWFMLYVVARQIREQGIDQMHDLEALMEEALQNASGRKLTI